MSNDKMYDEYLLKRLLEVSQEVQKVLVAIDKDMVEKTDIKELLSFCDKIKDEVNSIGSTNERGQNNLRSLLEQVLRQIESVVYKIKDLDNKTTELLHHRNIFRQGDYSDADLVKLGKHVKDANSMYVRSKEFDSRLHDVESIVLSLDVRLQALIDFIDGKNNDAGARAKLDTVFVFIDWANKTKGKIIFVFVTLMALLSILSGAPTIYNLFKP